MKRFVSIKLLAIMAILVLLFTNNLWSAPVQADGVPPVENKVSSLLSLHVRQKESHQSDSLQSRAQLFGVDSQSTTESTNVSRERVYMHFAQEPTYSQIADLSSIGVTVYAGSWIPPVNDFQSGFVLADIPLDKLNALTAKSYIVSLDTAEQELSLQNDQAREHMSVNPVWNSGDTGSGVTVAVIDSGLDTSNPDFPVPVAAIDYSNYPSTDSTVANTVSGHGTHVTGSLLGRGTHSSIYKGVAPGASLVFIKVGNDTDGGITSDAVTYAIRDAVDIYHAKIINISLGILSQYHDGTDQWCQAVDYATSQGTTVFAAAGNNASNGWHYSGTVAAGSTTSDIQITGTSASYLATNLVWFDGLGTHNNLTLNYYDSSHKLLSSIAGNQSESTRGTESNHYYFASLQNTGTYYLRVQNASNASQLFHIYYMGGSNTIAFSQADPNYTIASPAEADGAIAVGAYVTRYNWTNYQGRLYSYNTWETVGSVASFSSRGPRVDTGAPNKPELLAPGSAIISVRDPLYAPGNPNYDPIIIDNDGQNLNGAGPANYIVMQGTSMASPIAAGVGTLILSKYPTYTPLQIKQAMEITATDLGITGWDNIFGWGIIRANRAVNFTFEPQSTTNWATSISSGGATLNGTLTSKGAASSVSVSFEYGLTTYYGFAVDGNPPTLGKLGTFSAVLNGLEPGQIYHFRTKADGGTFGVSYGTDMTFLAVNPYSVGKIAFVSSPQGNSDIFIMNADGTSITQLTTYRFGDVEPNLSHDGTKIVYNSVGEIVTMNADGTNKINVTNNPANDVCPSWSPDGKKIAFISDRSGKSEIYTMNADGSNVTRLTYLSSLYYYLTSWSPDGTRIAFSANTNSSQMAIYTIKFDGSNLVKLTNNSSQDMYPAWSPDGTKIVFSSSGDGEYGIMTIMNCDGTNRTSLGIFGLFPTWSPDGTRIAFVSDSQIIYSMNADGSFPVNITSMSQNYNNLSWAVGGVVNPTKLTVITSPQTITAGTASTKITVQTQDNITGNPLNVSIDSYINLTSTSLFGKFDTSFAGPFDGSVTQVMIPAGGNQVSFYYKDTMAGTPTITAASSGYADITQQETINAGAASQVRVETDADGSGTVLPYQHVTAGHPINAYAVARDEYGNFVSNSFGTWSLTNKTMSVADSDLVPAADGKSAVYTGHLIGTCTIHVTSGSLTSIDSSTIVAMAGDADGDGVINMADVTKVERMILGLDLTTPEADASMDGAVNMGDVTSIERIILGLASQ